LSTRTEDLQNLNEKLEKLLIKIDEQRNDFLISYDEYEEKTQLLDMLKSLSYEVNFTIKAAFFFHHMVLKELITPVDNLNNILPIEELFVQYKSERIFP